MQIKTMADIFNQIIKTDALIAGPAADFEINRCKHERLSYGTAVSGRYETETCQDCKKVFLVGRPHP
jgi:hypothetical protein